MDVCRKKANCSGLHEEECCQQVEGGVPSPLLSTDGNIPGVLCLVLDSPVQERQSYWRESRYKESQRHLPGVIRSMRPLVAHANHQHLKTYISNKCSESIQSGFKLASEIQ